MPRSLRKHRIRRKGIRRFIGERRKTHRPSRCHLSKSIEPTDDALIVGTLHAAGGCSVAFLPEQGETPSAKNKVLDDAMDFTSAGESSSSIGLNIASPFYGFDTHSESEGNFDISQPMKKPLRVLSMFDGLAAGLIAIRNLGLDIEVYYACEIDRDALKVVKCNFPEVVNLGCVKSLSTLWDGLGRIDLLLGASPCEDISRVNPNRRLFNDPESTAFLFFEFVKARDHFRRKATQDGSRLFWLFENTYCMDSFMLSKMNKSLGCDPVMRCASEYVPMVRRRFFWSNIPISSEATLKPPRTRTHLQTYLKPDRWATVPVIGTLTTNSNSQRMGSQQDFPIVEAGEPSQLHITEMEQLFCFPEHYTDHANLSITARRRLIGKAWCIAVIEDLLSPLSLFF